MRQMTFCLLLVATILSAGCAERRVDVTGKVTYNKEVLDKPGGKIVFVSASGVQVAADIGSNGTYQASQVVVGPNRIAVYYPNPDVKKNARPFPVKGQPPPKRDEAAPETPAFLTPAKYASIETSELSTNVEMGKDYDADLTGPPIK